MNETHHLQDFLAINFVCSYYFYSIIHTRNVKKREEFELDCACQISEWSNKRKQQKFDGWEKFVALLSFEYLRDLKYSQKPKNKTKSTNFVVFQHRNLIFLLISSQNEGFSVKFTICFKTFLTNEQYYYF